MVMFNVNSILRTCGIKCSSICYVEVTCIVLKDSIGYPCYFRSLLSLGTILIGMSPHANGIITDANFICFCQKKPCMYKRCAARYNYFDVKMHASRREEFSGNGLTSTLKLSRILRCFLAK